MLVGGTGLVFPGVPGGGIGLVFPGELDGGMGLVCEGCTGVLVGGWMGEMVGGMALVG